MRTLERAVMSSCAVALLAAASCATLHTSADYDSRVDFSAYHTYAWKDVHPGRDPILDRRIKTSLAATLAAKGMHPDPAAPDLWVATHTRVGYEPSPVTWSIGWGWGWRWGPAVGVGVPVGGAVAVGTLVVDLVDVRAMQLVWRGTATDVLDRGASPAEKDAAIARAVDEMFRDFPPRPGGRQGAPGWHAGAPR